MDTFLPKVFAEPPIHPDAIEADAWIFSCQCGKYYSSQDKDSVVEVRRCRDTESFCRYHMV